MSYKKSTYYNLLYILYSNLIFTRVCVWVNKYVITKIKIKQNKNPVIVTLSLRHCVQFH